MLLNGIVINVSMNSSGGSNNNIQTRPIFSGNILRHPAFRNLKSNKNKLNSFKNSDYIMKNGLLIGCHQGLKEVDIKYIHNSICYKIFAKFEPWAHRWHGCSPVLFEGCQSK